VRTVRGRGNRFSREDRAGSFLQWRVIGRDGAICQGGTNGGKHGEWSWVSYKERKALGPESSGRNGQRQSNEYGGSDSSRGDGFNWYGEDRFRNRSSSRDGWSAAPSRVRVLHEYGHGRSLTHRRDRPFSCS